VAQKERERAIRTMAAVHAKPLTHSGGDAPEDHRGEGSASTLTGACPARILSTSMVSVGCTYWRDGDQHWLGYLDDFPDYLTQGESLDDLQEHLRDLHQDLTSGQIPAVRQHAELLIA
jgi:hypothetical protein